MIPMMMRSKRFIYPDMLSLQIPVVMELGVPLTANRFDQEALSYQDFFIEDDQPLLIVGGRHSIVKALKDMGNGARHFRVNFELSAYLARETRELKSDRFFSKTYTVVELCELAFSPYFYACTRIGRKKGIRVSPDRVLLESLAESLAQEFDSQYG